MSGNSLLDAFGTYLIGADGTLVYFDCVVAEQVTRDAEITEFPVETGANISDHYRVKPNEVRLEVFMSNEPINPAAHPEAGGFYGSQILNTPPYPGGSALATVAKAVLNPVGSIASAIGGLLDGTTRPVVMNSVLQFPTPFDSLSLLLAKLDAFRSGAVLIDIVTASQTYKGFVLGKVETSRDKETGSGAKVGIEFRRIITVSTQQVTAPTPVLKKDKPPINKGAQMPTDPGPMTSLASGIKSLITGGP